jgi:hypothetical protein
MRDLIGRISVLVLAAGTLVACTSANPLGVVVPGLTHKDVETIRGVVNGVWQHDPDKNRARLQGMFIDAADSEANLLSQLHQVRVGINRSYFLGSAFEVVLLPEGWSYSLAEIVDDGHTINVGDVVDVRGRIGTKITTVTSIVRKCNAEPLPDENKDWGIGCKSVSEFDASGYGGEKYCLSGF